MPKSDTRLVGPDHAPRPRPARSARADAASLFVKGYPRRAKPSVRPLSEVMAALDETTAANVLKVLLDHTPQKSGRRPN